MLKFKKTMALITILLMLTQGFSIFAAGGGFSSTLNNYTLGDLNGQDGWVTNEATPTSSSTIAFDPKDAGNKVIKLERFKQNYTSASATRTFEPAGESGLATVEFRFLLSKSESYEGGIKLKSDKDTIVDVQYKYFSGTNGKSMIYLSQPAIGADAGTAPMVNHEIIQWPGTNVWYTFKFILNFNTRTFDVYIATNGIMPETPKLTNIPFAAANITNINQIQLYTGGWKDSGYYFDDIFITGESGGVVDGEFNIQPDSAVYTDNTSTVDVSANIIMPVVGVGEATVIAAAYDINNKLLSKDITFMCNKDDLVDGVIPYQKTLSITSGNVATVKLFVWNSLSKRIALCNSVDCSKTN